MLSNHIEVHHRLVMFRDEVGIERQSTHIMEKLLKEQNIPFKSFDDNCDRSSSTAVVLPPLSKLEINHNEASIIDIIQSFKVDKNVSKILIWATSKNVESRLLIPFLEHMSDIVITVKSKDVLTILSRRKFGTIRLKDFQHELLQGKLFIKELKVDKKQKVQAEPAVNPETLGTFKIGAFTPAELEAKNQLKLPFELM